MIYKTICQGCETEFEWKKRFPEQERKFCSQRCAVDFNNRNQFKWENLTFDEKQQKLKEILESKVVRKEGCWGWKGAVNLSGYANIYYRDKFPTNIQAHRLAYQIYKGKFPEELCVCHSCDNKTCTNPDHLWLGTLKDNCDDRHKKGRDDRGEERWNSKLTEENVKEIRVLLSLKIPKTIIASKFNVSDMTIHKISIGKSWKHVT